MNSVLEPNGKQQDPISSRSCCHRIWSKCVGVGSIVGLYLGFYGSLSILVAIMFQVMLKHSITSHEHAIGTGIINSRPGLRFFPLPPGDNYNVFTIWYNRSRPRVTKKYTSALLDIINKEFKAGVNYIHCNHDLAYHDGKFMRDLNARNTYCNVYDHEHLDWGETCTPFGNGSVIKNMSGPFPFTRMAFGFTQGKPCIMVRLNRISEWKPSKTWLTEEKIEEYRKVGVKLHPMWRSKIEEFWKNHTSSHDNYIWISCDGVTEEDRELMGEIAYFPKERPGLPKIYFPFRGKEENYLAPFIFIQFLNPTPHVVLRIECVAFDNNINLNQHLVSPVGTTNFELLID